MVQVSRPTGFNGSALVRLLSGLTELDVRESGQGFADRLSQWLGWTDAIALSAAMSGDPKASLPTPRLAAGTQAGQSARVKAAAVAAIAEDARAARMELPGDFAPFRRRYAARQQAMATSIGPLRERLREALAAGSPGMARLAAIDAVMEQALAGREHRLLATVPALLEKHFKRLPQADQETFGKTLQSVLLAELDIRMQPVEGLVAAFAGR